MLTRLLILLVLCLQLAHCSHWPARSAKGAPDSSPLAWNGMYHFNATDSDFDSHLEIKFYRNRGDSMEWQEWLADGTIENSLIHQKITFKRGGVRMTESGPDIYCIHMQITPDLDDSQRKAFLIDGRIHSKE